MPNCMEALIDRHDGYHGRNARDVQADMERAIDENEAKPNYET